MRMKNYIIIALMQTAFIGSAQHPLNHWTETIDIRYSSKQPIVNYVLSVDSSDYSSYAVEMKISNVSDTFEVAMVAHPEYDDRYWRYVESFSVDTKTGKGKFI